MNTSCNRVLTSTALANERDVQKSRGNNSEGSSQNGQNPFKKRSDYLH